MTDGAHMIPPIPQICILKFKVSFFTVCCVSSHSGARHAGPSACCLRHVELINVPPVPEIGLIGAALTARRTTCTESGAADACLPSQSSSWAARASRAPRLGAQTPTRASQWVSRDRAHTLHTKCCFALRNVLNVHILKQNIKYSAKIPTLEKNITRITRC